MANNQSSTQQLSDRYSEALMGLAQDQQLLDRIAKELSSLAQAANDNAELQQIISSPLMKREEQGRAVMAVLKNFGASQLMQNFIGLLAQNRRLPLLPSISARFAEKLRLRRGEVLAQVTVARELQDDQKTLLQKTLSERLGRKVDIVVSVDPSILGGLIVRIGSQQIDDSLKTKLNNLAFSLKSA